MKKKTLQIRGRLSSLDSKIKERCPVQLHTYIRDESDQSKKREMVKLRPMNKVPL